MQRLLVGIFGAAVVVAATLAASPASAAPPARAAGSATSFQNATIAAAMAKVPGGTRVSPSQVQWTSGMTLSVAAGPNQRSAAAALAVNDCPTGDFCVWDGAGFGGSIEAQCPSAFHHGSTYFCPIWQVVTVVHSYSNKTAYRTWLQQNNSHTSPGIELCINSRNFGGNTNSNYNGSSEFDAFAWMSDNTAACT